MITLPRPTREVVHQPTREVVPRQLAKTDPEWSEKLEAALTASRRVDLEHGTNAAYVKGCVCKECREHQRQRMARNRG